MRRDLGEVVRALGGELDELALSALRLQDGLGLTVPDHAAMLRLQVLDRMTQTLFCLGPFLRRLAIELPALEVELQPALAEISLSALARRLEGASATVEVTDECELFEAVL